MPEMPSNSIPLGPGTCLWYLPTFFCALYWVLVSFHTFLDILWCIWNCKTCTIKQIHRERGRRKDMDLLLYHLSSLGFSQASGYLVWWDDGAMDCDGFFPLLVPLNESRTSPEDFTGWIVGYHHFKETPEISYHIPFGGGFWWSWVQHP